MQYRLFLTKDPNDDTMIMIYVDVETGEAECLGYDE